MTFTPYQRKFLTLSSLGGALEFYDFIIFIYYAKIISDLFFPATDTLASLMKTFAVFAVGYLVRPLGGIIFSHFGDKYGRKATFIASVFLMALPTFLMGLLPTYQSIGITATILLVLLRVLQGLSIGGEIPGALVFVAESVSPNARGRTCGLLFFGYLMGLLLGALVTTLLNQTLSANALASWGWRLPFLFGGLLGVLSFYLRRSMHETPVFQKLTAEKRIALPALEALKQTPVQIFAGVGIVLSGAVSVVLFFLFMPTYLTTVLHYSTSEVLSLNSASIILYSIFVALAGRWSDALGRRPLIIIANVCLLITAYPLFNCLHLGNFKLVILVILFFAIISGVITACFVSMMSEIFPTAIRYSGIAIAYNLGFAVFGGLTPLIATSLIKFFENDAAPSFYLILCALLTIAGALALKENRGKSLEEIS